MQIKHIDLLDYQEIPDFGMTKRLNPKPGVTIQVSQSEIKVESNSMLTVIPIHNIKCIVYQKEEFKPKIEFNIEEYNTQMELEESKRHYKKKK